MINESWFDTKNNSITWIVQLQDCISCVWNYRDEVECSAAESCPIWAKYMLKRLDAITHQCLSSSPLLCQKEAGSCFYKAPLLTTVVETMIWSQVLSDSPTACMFFNCDRALQDRIICRSIREAWNSAGVEILRDSLVKVIAWYRDNSDQCYL